VGCLEGPVNVSLASSWNFYENVRRIRIDVPDYSDSRARNRSAGNELMLEIAVVFYRLGQCTVSGMHAYLLVRWGCRRGTSMPRPVTLDENDGHHRRPLHAFQPISFPGTFDKPRLFSGTNDLLVSLIKSATVSNWQGNRIFSRLATSNVE
jgi:hypothetical protein